MYGIVSIQSVHTDESNGAKMSATVFKGKNPRRKEKMSLSDREKFIVHLITVQVIGAVEKAPDAAYKVLETLKDARVRKLPEKEVEEIILAINEEMNGAGTFLNHRRKEMEDKKFQKETEKWR